MNNLRNSVRLIGNLGANPEIKQFEKGSKMARFTMATNDVHNDKDGKKVTDTQWHQVVAWGKSADIVEEYLSKGSEVAIEGKLISRSYDSKDGEKKYITEIVLNELMMLGKKA
ncbi:MAG: single-stranded DNA-binding protein [Saprospiraceae bacterium]|nr:single-stranded DNA-binding protein [Saprospiraceae bacterium]